MPPEWGDSLETVRERQNLDTRWIAGVAGGTAVLLGLCLWGLWLFYAAGGKLGPPQPASQFPAPALQNDPEADLRAWETAQEAELETYAWVDRAHGIAQVPIERAMQLVVARGEKAYDQPTGGGQ